jgi:GrpB-like predicted nucleotidyltransferase (UPF0157 family)
MLEKYSKDWVVKYNKEAELIKKLLGSEIIDIQHIGSTAIPGLSAKPIIDIAVYVSSIKNISHFTELLEKMDYNYKPDMSSVERIFLRKGDPVEYHLSIACPLHTFWERQILFRDYLISHPEYVKEYGDLKKETIKNLQEEDFKDLSRSKGYSAKKGPFVEKILKLAEEEK